MKRVLENDFLKVTIDDHGAELVSIYDKEKDREVIWQGDPRFWGRHAPVLFPNVGKHYGNHYRIGDKEYASKQHGFARDTDFTCIDSTLDSVTHQIRSTEETKEVYPFDFVLRIRHILKGRTLTVSWKVANNSDTDMYFAIGGHPAFRVPVLPDTRRSDYRLTFDGQESLTYLLLDPESGTAKAEEKATLKLENGTLSTFPLAGTRPRGKTREEDKALEEGLLKDEKELAEHNMLVDLGRNDIGKISELGSVKVEKYLTVERYSCVMHLGSTVTGTIKKGKDAIDAVDAILPAGTLSGAPKFRACQIIQELEQSKRGIYGGAIGYLDFAGNLDTCIAIRLVYKKNGEICIRSGAGIVADSIPESEFQECCNKARAVVQAIETAQEGLE